MLQWNIKSVKIYICLEKDFPKGCWGGFVNFSIKFLGLVPRLEE